MKLISNGIFYIFLKITSIVFVFIFTALPNFANAQFWKLGVPKTFDECILINMKGVTSDVAAKNIRASCAEQFKIVPSCSDRNASIQEITNLSIKYWLSSSNNKAVLFYNIYNGNISVKIKDIIIGIKADNISTPEKYKLFTNYDVGSLSTAESNITLHSDPKGNVKITTLSASVCD